MHTMMTPMILWLTFMIEILSVLGNILKPRCLNDDPKKCAAHSSFFLQSTCIYWLENTAFCCSKITSVQGPKLRQTFWKPWNLQPSMFQMRFAHAGSPVMIPPPHPLGATSSSPGDGLLVPRGRSPHCPLVSIPSSPGWHPSPCPALTTSISTYH